MSAAPDYAERLGAWAVAHHGPQARVENVASLGGHSAVTIGFDLVRGTQLLERLVLKLPPPGARAKANFDFLRQVPLFKVLEKHGALAPVARWWTDDPRWFGQPGLIMSRLAGASLPDIFDAQGPQVSPESGKLFLPAMTALLRIHSIDGLAELAGWSTPRLLAEEIDHWVTVLRKSTNTAWVARGEQLRAMLHASAPQECALGIVHGDFYSNNWLFDGDHLTGVVDWESTTLGPVLLDLGWVCMMYDAQSWGPLRRARMGWHPGPQTLLEAYRQGTKLDLSGIGWYRALAGYRLACNTAYYYELHRSGKRVNPAWDVLGESFPFMLERGFEMLERALAS